MLSILADVAPKSVIASAVLWAGANYMVIGPEIASRIVRADHLPACQENFRGVAMKAGEERAKALQLPSFDPAQEFALERLRALRNNPMMQELRQMSGGMGDVFGINDAADMALRQYEQGKEAAQQAYEAAKARIEAETATELGKAGDVCGCLADAAIGETRTEWAMLSGSLGLIRPAPLKSFDTRMAQLQSSGRCAGGKAGA